MFYKRLIFFFLLVSLSRFSDVKGVGLDTLKNEITFGSTYIPFWRYKLGNSAIYHGSYSRLINKNWWRVGGISNFGYDRRNLGFFIGSSKLKTFKSFFQFQYGVDCYYMNHKTELPNLKYHVNSFSISPIASLRYLLDEKLNISTDVALGLFYNSSYTERRIFDRNLVEMGPPSTFQFGLLRIFNLNLTYSF